MITDIHCHFIPEEYFRLVRERPEFDVRVIGGAGDAVDLECRGLRYGLNRTFFEPARQVARMDDLGIDRTVISLATPLVNYYLDAPLAAQAAQICNDGFAALVADNPERFAAWAFLPMQDPPAAAEELRRCVRDYGFVGGHVATNVRGVYLPDERFRPIFDAAAELDVPLFLHPVDPPGKDRTGDYELTVVAGYLFDSTINVLRMICSNFLDRYAGAEARVRAYRRLQPDAAQPHAARGRHQRGALAHPAAQDRRLSAHALFRYRLLRARLSAASPLRSCRRRTCCSAAMRRFRSASRIRSTSSGVRLPPEHAKLALSENFRRLTGR